MADNDCPPGLTYKATVNGRRIYTGTRRAVHDATFRDPDYAQAWGSVEGGLEFWRTSDSKGPFACTPEIWRAIWAERQRPPSPLDAEEEALDAAMAPPRHQLTTDYELAAAACDAHDRALARERREDELDASAPGPFEARRKRLADEAKPYLGLGTWGQATPVDDSLPPIPGPLLTVDDGRPSLHLDRLSGDCDEAARQLAEAMKRGYTAGALLCAGFNFVGGVLEFALANAFSHTRSALRRGWPLAPHLRAIEDAHRALCVAQCKSESEGGE